MIKIIDNFYPNNYLGLMVLNFLNLHFENKHQPFAKYFGGDRKLGIPVYETTQLEPKDPLSPYNLFFQTFLEKTNIKPLYVRSFFRKTKLSEMKESPSWKQYRPHTDDNTFFDIAGLIYYNSNSLKDGTYIYNSIDDYEPTVIVGSRFNRCVFYDPKQPHSPTMEQSVEERWTQPFFLIHKEETFKKFKEDNN